MYAQTPTLRRIPELSPPADQETPREYGLRAFRFLLVEHVAACLLPDYALEQAMYASQVLVTGKDLQDSTRTAYHAIRTEIQATIHRRRTEQSRQDAIQARHAARQDAIAPDTDQDTGGMHDRHPQPPTRPTAPAARVQFDF